MSRFLIGINEDMMEECRSVMLHDNMDLSKLMVHIQQVEESRNKREIHNARRPKPHDQACPRNKGNMNNLGIHE